MSVYIDRKYLLLVSSRLSKFTTKKEDLFNFRCPICGDSQKSLHKARGYVYRKGNDYFYSCKNCGISTTFAKFLQHVDADQYRGYVLERYSNGENKHSNYKKPDMIDYLTGPRPSARYKKISSVPLESIEKLPDGHYAKEYISNRRIPKQFWNEIFYAENFKTFLDEFFPEHGKEKVPEDPRIVLMCADVEGNITTISGRALSADNQMRYVKVKILDEKKVFGLHRLNLEDRVYITEGEFDSLFLPNAVASGDANLNDLAEYLRKLGCNDIVIVYDNQPRNKDIVRQIKEAIDYNNKVVLLPYDESSKDLNEMVKNGMSLAQVKELIDKYTCDGLAAQMKFKEWRKC
jgi:transcription elongation factor Elf1